jgi:hypothetical protein
MRLADLNPKLVGDLSRGFVIFDCPVGHGHRFRVPIHAAPFGEVDGVKHWQASGEFPDTLSLAPSVDASQVGCWHGFITNGEVR